MIFSQEKWNDASELQPFVQASAALSFSKCAPSFQRAEEKYLLAVLGEDMMKDVQTMYDSSINAEPQLSLLRALQSAEANLAFADDFDEFQIRLTDQGVQRQETEKFKQAYRYQEHNMQRLYLNRGLNALDRAIKILDGHANVFDKWSRSEYRIARQTLVVRSPQEVSECHFINNSAIIYLRLLPSIRLVTDLALPTVIGSELHYDFMQALKDGEEYIKDIRSLSVEEFRKSIAKYVIFASLAILIRETGSITERGLYFGSVKATTPNPDEATPASRSQIAALAQQFDDNAYRYGHALQNIVKNSFPNYFGGYESDVYKHDNRHKRMVWL